MKPGESKKLLQQRVEKVKKDLKDNREKYNTTNIALREYEILTLNQRILQYN